MKDFFKDRDGNIVIIQRLNLPAIVWLASTIVLYAPLHERLTDFLSLISFGAIFTWAWMEIFSGVNTFRMVLGGIVMIVIIVNRL